jgi:hypothetical protein
MVRMAYTPRQVAVRAQEVAIEFLRMVARDHLVESFLDGYAREFDRHGRAARPVRRQELIEVINREVLLSMISRMETLLPQRLRFRAEKRLPPAQVRARQQTIDLFREEFLVALGRGAEWQDEEFENFCHDLSLYKRLAGDQARPTKTRKLAAPVVGPFVDRVGLMLDPAMLDKARRAAAKFQLQLDAAADRALRSVFSMRKN